MQQASYFAGWLVDGTGISAKHDVLVCVENGSISSVDSVNPAGPEGRGMPWKHIRPAPYCPV